MNKAKPASKSAMFQELASKTGLTKKQVSGFFDAYTDYIKGQIGKKGPGVVAAIPGLLKVMRVEKPATKERMGINPQTKEPMVIKAKPKRTIVRARPLKALKEMVK